MDRPKIAMIDVLDDPSYEITEIFRLILADSGFSRDILIKIDGLNYNFSLPQNIEVVGIIISGSVHHIYEDEGKEWKDNLCDFIRKFQNRTPILGICFGHNAIAQALGAEVGPNERGKEIGCLPIYTTEEARKDILFAQFKSGSLVSLSHLDSVLVLPENAIHLAFNEHSVNQAFRVGKSWGIQFHPELQPRLFKQLLLGRIKRLRREAKTGEADELQVISDSVQECPEAVKVLKRFVSLCFTESQTTKGD